MKTLSFKTISVCISFREIEGGGVDCLVKGSSFQAGLVYPSSSIVPAVFPHQYCLVSRKLKILFTYPQINYITCHLNETVLCSLLNSNIKWIHTNKWKQHLNYFKSISSVLKRIISYHVTIIC